MDENKKERESVKELSFSKKCQYIWDYYKIHIFALVFVGIFLGMIVQSYIDKREVALHAVLLNVQSTIEQAEIVKARYMDKLELDTNVYDVFLDTTMYFDYEKPESIDVERLGLILDQNMELQKNIAAMQQTIDRAGEADPSLPERVAELEKEISATIEQINALADETHASEMRIIELESRLSTFEASFTRMQNEAKTAAQN